jgi:hypothetical protein
LHLECTGQFKKKVTLLHVYNEVTSECTIMRYASILRKTLKVLICYLTNTQCGNPVSPGTRQSDSPFLSRLSLACPCLWLPQWRWCAVSILEDHLAGVVCRWRPWHTPEKEVTLCEVCLPGRPGVEGQVSDDSTSNPAVWQIFIQVMALRLIFIVKSAITWMKIFHTAGLDMLSSLTCPSTLCLPGHQISHCDFFLWGYVKDIVYVPALPNDLQEISREY